MDPAAHTGDGFQDIIIVRSYGPFISYLLTQTLLLQVKKVSYLAFLRYLIRSAYQTSSPFTLPYVTAVRVKEWDFTPDEVRVQETNVVLKYIFHLQDKPSEVSSWNCDGELVDNPSIFVKSYKQLVPVFARYFF